MNGQILEGNQNIWSTLNKSKYTSLVHTSTSAQVGKKIITIYMGYEGHQCMILGYLYFGLNVF